MTTLRALHGLRVRIANHQDAPPKLRELKGAELEAFFQQRQRQPIAKPVRKLTEDELCYLDALANASIGDGKPGAFPEYERAWEMAEGLQQTKPGTFEPKGSKS